MARKLRPMAAVIDVDPDAYEFRNGSPYPPVSPSGSLRALIDHGDSPGAILVALDDDDLPVADSVSGVRVVDLPTVSGDGIRAWYGVEVLPHEQPDGTRLHFRINDGARDLYWNGSAWAEATDPAHWNDHDTLQAAFSSLGPAVRIMTIRVWLEVDDGAEESPSVERLAVIYGVRDRGDEDDALVRTMLRTLRESIRCTGELRWTTSGATAFELSRTGGGGVPPIVRDYSITDVLAVFDLAADPDEESPLSGSWAPDSADVEGRTLSGTWTPDSPPSAGSSILLEFEFAPQIVIALTHDAIQVQHHPMVLILPDGAAPTRLSVGDRTIVRRLDLEPPTAIGVDCSDREERELDVRIIGESHSDGRRIADALRAWIGKGRVLRSPETGRKVRIVETSPPAMTTGALASGTSEIRASWRITFERATTAEIQAIHLVRDGGVIASVGG